MSVEGGTTNEVGATGITFATCPPKKEDPLQ